MFEKLDDSNFMLFAAKYYDNPSCSGEEEFYGDLARIKNLHRLFNRHAKTGELRDRLILNHLIVLYNVFEPQAATRMLAYKLYEHLPRLKPFLSMMGYWPEKITGIGKTAETILDSNVVEDPAVVAFVKSI